MNNTRVIATDYIEVDSKFLNLPINLKKMLDEDGNPSTPLAYTERINGVIIYNHDKSRAMMPFEMSFDDGDYDAIIEAVSNPDLKALFDEQPTLLRNDLLNTDAHIVRVLNYSKKIELMKVNENWNKEADEVVEEDLK